MSRSYDSKKHHRQSIRLRDWDYRSAGYYFVTICTHQRNNLFGKVVNGDMCFNEYGQIVENAWQAISSHEKFSHVQLGDWIVMPNHLHGIIVIEEPVDVDEDEKQWLFGKVQPGSLGIIVGSTKSLVARRINNMRRTPGASVWQRGYYERIIRNEQELNAIICYIQQNPARWQSDRENLDITIQKMSHIP